MARINLRQILYAFAVTLLLALPLLGQHTMDGGSFTFNYTSSPGTPTMVDHTAWCATHDCYVGIGGPGGQVSVGADGTLYELSTPGNKAYPDALYTYTPASGWVAAASGLQTAGGNAITQVSVGGFGNFLALTAGTNNVYGYNTTGGAHWYSLPGNGTCTWVAIASDGTMVCLNSDGGHVYLYDRTSQTWNLIGSDSANVAVENSATILAVNAGNNGLYIYEGEGNWTQITPLPFTPSTLTTAITLGGQNLAMLDTGGHLYTSTALGESGTWSAAFDGAGLNTVTGGAYTLFELTDQTLGHVNLLVPQVSMTTSGYSSCPGDPTICQNINHTLHANVTWNGVATDEYTIGPAGNQLQVTAFGNGDLCDPLLNPESEFCQGSVEGDTVCPYVGTLASLSGIFKGTGYGEAVLGLQWTGTSSAGPSKNDAWCDVKPYCTPETNPPLCGGPSKEFITLPQGVSAQTECGNADHWKMSDPYFNISIFGHIVHTFCTDENFGATWLGKGAPAVVCTTTPD